MASTTTVTNQDITDASAHVLPGLVAWLIDNALLPLLLIAEGYLMGSLFARGWVSDIETPSQWGVYHAIGVCVFYAAGAATAGLGLRASVTFAASLRLKRWGFAFLNLLTVTGLSVAELWSSFSERSFHLAPSPADEAVLRWLHQPDTGITPTLVVVSLVLPFVSLTYGFSQQHKAQQRLAVQGASVQAEEDEDEEEAAPAPVASPTRVRRLPTARGASLWGKQRQASVSSVAAEEVGPVPLEQAQPVPSS
jgi:hypothetical protein